MIIKTKKLQEVCSKILPAVESSDLASILDTLQLKTVDKVLCLSVTNKEYYVEVKLDITDEVDFHATVSANLFLKLVSQITAEDIELTVTETTLNVKANGSYKLPLIFEGERLMELPVIEINNVVKNFDISSSILNSILDYNTKELDKGTISRPVQKLFYIDERGAITFTTGACVNSFELSEPVRILLNKRLVKLFKLFKDCSVKFTLAYDAVPGSEDIIQTKVKFEAADITITSILSCDDSMLGQVPVTNIRNRADNLYPHSVVLSKSELMATLGRLVLFTSDNTRNNLKPYIHFNFGPESVEVSDIEKENKEVIKYLNKESGIDENYEATLDIVDLKLTLDTCVEPSVTLSFGDGNAFVLSRGSIKNVIPEVRIME